MVTGLGGDCISVGAIVGREAFGRGKQSSLVGLVDRTDGGKYRCLETEVEINSKSVCMSVSDRLGVHVSALKFNPIQRAISTETLVVEADKLLMILGIEWVKRPIHPRRWDAVAVQAVANQ